MLTENTLFEPDESIEIQTQTDEIKEEVDPESKIDFKISDGLQRKMELGEKEIIDNEDKWFLMDGIEGEGEKPDFFNDKTFKTLADQAKAQNESRKKIGELSNKLGAFTGAPDGDYEIQLDETLKDLEIEIDHDNNFLKSFKTLAKEQDMSNGKFNNWINKFLIESESLIREDGEFKINELKKINKEETDDPQKALKELMGWWRQGLPSPPLDLFKRSLGSADIYEVHKYYQKAFSESRISASNISPKDGYLEKQDKLDEMVVDQRYYDDKKFRDYVDARWKEFYNET